MVKAIFRLLSSAALLAAVIVGAKTADQDNQGDQGREEGRGYNRHLTVLYKSPGI